MTIMANRGLITDLIIEGKKETYFIPSVKCSTATGICEIKGESYLDYAAEFYERILDWITRYLGETSLEVTLNFKLGYFNTSTSKAILDMFHGLKQLMQEGHTIHVNWYYPQGDLESLEEAQELKYDSGLAINFIPFQKFKS